MRPSKRRTILLIGALALTLAPQLYGYTVLQMSLNEMTDRAGMIIRGRVIAESAGTVAAGGVTFPTVTYRVEVEHVFKGSMPPGKDGVTVVEVTMLGAEKMGAARVGNLRRLSPVPDLPRFEVGKTYVLLTTQPSSIGLVTTVGLGQGAFGIFTEEKTEMAVNQLNNQGLFDGPVTYAVLANEIQSAMAQ